MAKLSKREKVLLIVLCIAIIGYFYYTYLITPQLDAIAAEQQKLDDNKVVLSGLIQSQNNMESLKKELQELNKKAEESSKSIPDSSRIPEIIMDFKSISDSAGCTYGSLIFSENNASLPQPNNENQGANAKGDAAAIITIPINYQVSGSYNSIMQLLKLIEGNDRKMAVDNMSINKDPQSGNLTASLSINCFYLNNNNGQKIDYPFINSAIGKQNMFE